MFPIVLVLSLALMVSLNRLKHTLFQLHAAALSPAMWLVKLRALLILEMVFQNNIHGNERRSVEEAQYSDWISPLIRAVSVCLTVPPTAIWEYTSCYDADSSLLCIGGLLELKWPCRSDG